MIFCVSDIPLDFFDFFRFSCLFSNNDVNKGASNEHYCICDGQLFG
jgi:hypothetical protein